MRASPSEEAFQSQGNDAYQRVATIARTPVCAARLAFILAGLLAWPEVARAAPQLTAASGIVQIRLSGYQTWEPVKKVPLPLSSGDSIRTGSKSNATLLFDDSSRIEMGPNGAFTLDASQGRSDIKLELGTIRAAIQKLLSRRFVVRTPTAVCSVRGTEFSVEVLSTGGTIIDLFKGLLAVEDMRGQQVLLEPNERIEVDRRGLGAPIPLPTQTQLQKVQFHGVMRRELSLDQTKEEVLAAAAREIRTAEYQQHKVMVDVFGHRVRLEEYIIRSSPDQFKLVVLNERKDRFDYFYYLGTFNKTLPRDLSQALRQIPGGVDTEPEYFLTGFETGRSNTLDSAVEIAAGGHLVDVNHNGSTADDVAYFYDSKSETFRDVSGKNVYQSIFDKYGFYLNGKLKYGWTGSSAQSYQDVVTPTTDPITGKALAAALPSRSVSLSFPNAENMHQVIYESYDDGTFTRWDNYIINDDGKIATFADFRTTSGADYKSNLLRFNFEQVVTASEFSGRKIDLVVEPRILIEAGLIP